ERVRVFGGEELVEGVFLARPAAGPNAQRIHLVIADDGMSADVTPQPQGLQRIGPPVHEIPGAPQLVAPRVEGDRFQEVVELARTSLDVSDDPAHARSVAAWGTAGAAGGAGPEGARPP